MRVGLTVTVDAELATWCRWHLWRLVNGRAFATPVSPLLKALADRDGWRCWLCGNPVPRVFTVNADLAGSRRPAFGRRLGRAGEPCGWRIGAAITSAPTTGPCGTLSPFRSWGAGPSRDTITEVGALPLVFRAAAAVPGCFSVLTAA